MMLILRTDNDTTGFAPRDTVHGVAGWQLPAPPKAATLRLYWYTEGRGSQDLGLVQERPLSARAANHEEAFSFVLPEGPYSFAGKLIALKWAIELVIDRGRETARLDLLVSPWETEVVLAEVEKDRHPVFRIRALAR